MNTMLATACVVWTLLLLSAPAGFAQEQPAGASSPVTLRFWGHACFTISAGGNTLLIDPFKPEQVGYPAFDVTPDVVLITHEHFDHNDTSWLKGKPLVLHGLDRNGAVESIDRTVGPFHIRTVAGHHWDDPAQKARGNVAIFVSEVSGLKIVHVGDLGATLTPEQIESIGRPDVLLVPVGGFFTIDADKAWQVTQQLKPRAYVVPMHYRTPALAISLKSRLAEPNAFVRKFSEQVVRQEGNELRIDPSALADRTDKAAGPKVVVLDYRPATADTQPSASQPAGRSVTR